MPSHRVLPAKTRHAIDQSRLFVILVSPTWFGNPHSQAALAYATARGKPVRVLLPPGLRLPEDLFLGTADCQIARSTGAEGDRQQVLTWLEEIAP
jgi:hypothetical protein